MREEALFVQLMNPTILCGQIEMQALQLAYVSILLCLFLTMENSLPKRKAFRLCREDVEMCCGTFSPQNNWLNLIKYRCGKHTCSMPVEWLHLCACMRLFFKQVVQALLRDVGQVIWKKYFIFINVYSTCVGENPLSLQLSASCCTLHIYYHMLVIFTQAPLANRHRIKKHFS